MRFQNSQPSPPFGGRDRVMVFMFLGALLIFFAVKVGSKPEFWKAMKKKPGDLMEHSEVDTNPAVLLDDQNLFTQGGTETIAPPATVSVTGDSELRIPKGNLKPVRDNTMGIRASERPSYYATLKYARETDPAWAAEKSQHIPYTMLMAEPWEHRGKLVSIKGRLRRLVPMAAGANRSGISTLYDAWVFSEDSGSNPIHVVCSTIPPGIEPAAMYNNNPPEVTLNGYFFKTQGYRSQGDGTENVSLHTAPLVLASGLNFIPVVQAESRDIASEMVPWLWWFAIGVAAVLGMVLWNFAISDWSFRHTRAHGLLHAEPVPDFRGVDALSTGEMLYEMSRDGDLPDQQDYLAPADYVARTESVSGTHGDLFGLFDDGV